MHVSPGVGSTTEVYATTVSPYPPSTVMPGLPVPYTPAPPTTMAAPTITVHLATGPDRADFLNVAHSLWTILIAVAGGWFAACANRKEQSKPAAKNN